jgi:hypothetical protein
MSRFSRVTTRFERRTCHSDQFSETRNFLFVQRSIRGSGEHQQDLSASRARREVALAARDFIRLQRFFMVRRDQLGIGTLHGVAMRELIQGVAHAPRECFFPAAIA